MSVYMAQENWKRWEEIQCVETSDGSHFATSILEPSQVCAHGPMAEEAPQPLSFLS